MNIEQELKELNKMTQAIQEKVLQIRSLVPISSKDSHEWLMRVEANAANMVTSFSYAETYLVQECPALMQIAESPAE